MAKDSRKPKAPANETPFQRFERLAKKLVGVPKDKVREKPQPQS
jgi:hypothetical protein